ncbi:MAG TPA: hypothetical protein VGZ23_00270 [bacterium]|nr:hypothetical protein [bacterium]
MNRRARLSACAKTRRAAGLVAVVAMLCLLCDGAEPVRGQIHPAGSTAAVLSFVDGAAGRVEIARHWPEAPVDVDVYPFVPYFWNGCPGPGAVMILVTGPAASPPGAFSSNEGRLARLPDIAARLSTAVRETGRGEAGEHDDLMRMSSSLRTPGDPFLESVKAWAPLIADLATYERDGYAVFAFITWQGWRCGVTLRAVPEGYGIPFVR